MNYIRTKSADGREDIWSYSEEHQILRREGWCKGFLTYRDARDFLVKAGYTILEEA